MTNIFTIGVYNSTETSFFNKLTDNHIELFFDIRQRRGVRGSQYKYVNSKYLQSKLKDLGIEYQHIKLLAPNNEIRQKQKDADKANNETKKQRTHLGEVFKSEYIKNILNQFDMQSLADKIRDKKTHNIVFFCVEENASACHRSLVASKLAEILGCNITNL